MGLRLFELELLADVCAKLPKPFTVLSFGHPDILATPEQLAPKLGRRLLIDNKEVLVSRHGKAPKDCVGNAKEFFGALGGVLTVVDVRDVYGVDAIVDLNLPQTSNSLTQYDLVVDPGTAEHCFNVGTALINMANRVREGGYIYHANPLCHWNHGFWNFSPNVYAHLYSEANGFAIEKLFGEYREKIFDVQPSAKFEVESSRGRKHTVVCLARRNRMRRLEFPIQGKYA